MEQAATVEKAIDVLFHLHGRRDAEGVTAIGRALGMPKSSAHRLLASLSRRGLLERDERGRYRPGMGLVALGVGVLEREPVVLAGRPVLEHEAAALGETLFLVTARAGEIVIVEKAEGRGFLRASPRVGESVPVHATAVGKLFLAFAPDEVELPPGRLAAYTPATPTARGAVAAAAAEARRSGFARSRDEWIPGLSVVAAPVHSGGRMRAAVALAGSTPRIDELGGDALAARVIAAAEKVGARLEGRAS